MDSFKEAIKSIKNRYFIFEEFPLIKRDGLPEDCLKRAMAIEKEEIEYYALHLKNKELEGLLLDFVRTENNDEIDRAIEILCLRNSQRIIKLICYLSQYNYELVSLNVLCKKMLETSTEKQTKETAYLQKIGTSDDKITSMCQVIEEEGRNMDAVCKKYGISEKSPLAKESFLAYFNSCDKTAFLMNYKNVISLIEMFPAQKIHEMIANYLNVLSLIEFIDSVNLAISNKLGQPYVSTEWASYPVELRDKFAGWSYLYRLKIHCEDWPGKFRVLVKYFEKVRSNYEMEINENKVLITDFGWIVLADVKGNKNSYLYDKSLFEKEMAEWNQDNERVPSFLAENKEIMTARHFMITTDDARIIKLTFEEIHYYYIEEVLDIKLELEPDMRSNAVK